MLVRVVDGDHIAGLFRISHKGRLDGLLAAVISCQALCHRPGIDQGHQRGIILRFDVFRSAGGHRLRDLPCQVQVAFSGHHAGAGREPDPVGAAG